MSVLHFRCHSIIGATEKRRERGGWSWREVSRRSWDIVVVLFQQAREVALRVFGKLPERRTDNGWRFYQECALGEQGM